MNTTKVDDKNIEAILKSLAVRVLNNEQMNDFKKEIKMIAEYADKQEDQVPGTQNKIAAKLAQLFKKTDREMYLVLCRTAIMEKKKSQKEQVDKVRLVDGLKIYRCLI